MIIIVIVVILVNIFAKKENKGYIKGGLFLAITISRSLWQLSIFLDSFNIFPIDQYGVQGEVLLLQIAQDLFYCACNDIYLSM